MFDGNGGGGSGVFGRMFLVVMEVECLEMKLLRGGIFDLDGNFGVLGMELEVKNFELVVKVVVKLSWGCLSERMYFLWSSSHFGGHLLVMVMRKDFSRFLFFLDSIIWGR